MKNKLEVGNLVRVTATGHPLIPEGAEGEVIGYDNEAHRPWRVELEVGTFYFLPDELEIIEAYDMTAEDAEKVDKRNERIAIQTSIGNVIIDDTQGKGVIIAVEGDVYVDANNVSNVAFIKLSRPEQEEQLAMEDGPAIATDTDGDTKDSTEDSTEDSTKDSTEGDTEGDTEGGDEPKIR